jgi:putative YhdH/YhfP family quinone oxidoreductase
MSRTFQALVVRVSDDKNYTRAIEERSIDDLPQGEVLIRVHYSSLNYKDGLSCIGDRGVTRHYPHTPGIDAAGVIETSDSSDFKAGDPVVITSYDLGMNTAGGFGQFIRVPADWVMPLPEGLSLRDSMIYGTAGYTAGLSVDVLQRQGVNPEKGPIVVTGSTGGVGSVSVALLSSLGYTVSASTGKPDEDNFLRKLGASEVIGRDAVNDKYGKPLLKETWAGAIDTVGGETLATLLKACKESGAVVATGMVASTELPATVFPFILRGVSLLGINAQGTSMSIRQEIWSKLASEWKPAGLERLAFNCRLEKLNPEIDRILAGGQIGRVVVNLQ